MRRAPVGAYGVTVDTDRMAPVYNPGDVAHIAPRWQLKAGRDALLVRADTIGSGAARICRVVRVEAFTADSIKVRQYNPPRIVRLSRRRWRFAGSVYMVQFTRGAGERTPSL